MASTYGWLQGGRGCATRCGGKEGIWSKVQTWEGNINMTLDPKGNAKIDISGKINAVIENEVGKRVVFAPATREEVQKSVEDFDKQLEALKAVGGILNARK